MENLNEQDQIKDPNQLDMFAGILFTPEQEKMINDFLTRQKQNGIGDELSNQRNEKLLVNNGFIYGMDYVNTFKKEIVTREVSLGSRYNHNEFKVELTYETATGYISLKGKRFYQGELIDTTFGIDFEKDKVQSSTIQGQYRYIKPTTLLEKLKVYNERAEALLEEHKKKNSLKQNIIEKYRELYPNATVTAKDDWTKYSGSFEIVEVKFESGSFIQFRLDTYNNKEYLYKKHDAEFETLNSEELLNRFSKQVKKEGSN
jgi:hypothetical protein